MKRRRSILLDEPLDGRIERLARRHGRTFTDEVREALEKHVSESDEENSNQWLLDLAKKMETLDGLRYGPHLDVDSDLGKLHAARAIYRDATNSEPEW